MFSSSSDRHFRGVLSARWFAYIGQAWVYDCFGPSTQRIEELKAIARKVQDQLTLGGVAVEVKASDRTPVKATPVKPQRPLFPAKPGKPTRLSDGPHGQVLSYRGRTFTVRCMHWDAKPFVLQGQGCQYDLLPVNGELVAHNVNRNRGRLTLDAKAVRACVGNRRGRPRKRD